MRLGGKYDAECEALCLFTRASMSLVMVIGGNRGNGFSVSSTDPRAVEGLPEFLRSMANEIENLHKRQGGGGLAGG